MAYCNQTLAGIQLDCTSSMGGIKTVYIANYGDVASIKTDDDGVITEITMATLKNPEGEPIVDDKGKEVTAKFKPYQFRKQTGSLNSTLNVDETSGLNYVSSELSLVFTRMEFNKRLELVALSKGQLAVIVEDCNGELQYLGEDDYVSANGGGANSGTNKGDQNAYNLTLTAESMEYPRFVKREVLDTVVEM